MPFPLLIVVVLGLYTQKLCVVVVIVNPVRFPGVVGVAGGTGVAADHAAWVMTPKT